MTDIEKQRLWSLVLKYEDLEPVQRQMVDQALAADPELRKDWQQLSGVEDKAKLDWALNSDEFWQPEMDDVTAERCYHSLEKILAELPQEGENTSPFGEVNAPDPKTVRGAGSWARMLLPLAAVLALFILFPRLATNKNLIGPVAVQTVQIANDGTRSAQGADTIEGQLRTGQAFVLNVALQDAGWLVIYHVDPKGQYVEVFSGEAVEPTITVPDAASGGFWVLDGEPGSESFVVGAFGDKSPDLATLEAAVTTACAAAEGHAAVVSALTMTMDKSLSETRVFSFEHLD